MDVLLESPPTVSEAVTCNKEDIMEMKARSHKTLMLGKIEGGRRDMSLSELQEFTPHTEKCIQLFKASLFTIA